MILVTGVGRCGTSMVTEMLAGMGAHLCTHLIGPHREFNPRGHFECQRFWDLNHQIIDTGTFFEMPYLEEIRRHAHGEHWCVKGPAFARVWPVAGQYFEGCDLVVCKRGHEANIESLRRHSHPDDAEDWYWKRLAEVEICQESTFPRRVVQVTYESVLASPHAMARMLANSLDLPGDPRIAAEVVDPELCHATG